MNNENNITLVAGDGLELYQEGDQIRITSIDPRWWLRLWRWLTFQSPPTVEEMFVVRGIGVEGDEITIEVVDE